jgi:hypothetical protein
MIFRRAAFLVFVSFFLVRPSFAGPDAVNGMRLHWLGLNQISTDTNAAPFLKVWQLPQTTALVAQTLDKLSRWPGPGATNAASAALRPLLDDLITSEFFVELSAPTNSSLPAAPANNPSSIIHHPIFLAVRLPADRSRLWQTNLAAASAAWAAAGTPHRIECLRAGDWTLVGVGLDQNINIASTNFAAHFTSAHHRAIANVWLEADVNPSMLADFFSLSARPTGGEGRGEVGRILSPVTGRSSLSFGEVGISSSILHPLSSILDLHLTVSCDSSNLLTRATLDLARPFAEPLPSWQIPTNLIHGSLTSFAAVRGIAPWLAGLPAWQKLQLAPAPDQAFCWSQAGIPFQSYLAAPLPGASNQLFQLAGRLLPTANPWLAINAEGSFSWSPSPPGIFWKDANILTPYLICDDFNHRDYVLGGLYQASAPEPTLLPAGFLDAIQHQPNLVLGGFEETGGHVDDDFFISQMTRVIFHKPQMTGATAGTLWLKAIEQHLGETTTLVTRDGPQQLVLERRSTLGCTALELHLLADWLESPQFPHGLHTFLAPPDK